MPNIILRIKDKQYGGWTGIIVEKSLYQMSGTFALKGTNIYPGDFEKWGFGMGDECQIAIDDQILINGYIEDINMSYDDKNHSIQFGGRDRTGDLVDCSFVEDAKTWTGQTILSVIKALCNSFNIDVEVDDSVQDQVNAKTPNNTFTVNEGETTFDSIQRLCIMAGVLAVSYGDGKLTLTGTGSDITNDILELGINIKTGDIEQSNRDRFQKYIVKGIGKKQKAFWKSAESVDQPKGKYIDELIFRNRPFILLAESGVEQKNLEDRAKWECVNRAGKSRTVFYEVQGWQQSNGDIWPLNTKVIVIDDFLEIDEKLLISNVRFSLDEDTGSITRLTLVHPKTFELPPYNPTKEISTGVDWGAAAALIAAELDE